MSNTAKKHDDAQFTGAPINYALEAEILGTPLAAALYQTGDPKQALQYITDLPRESFMREDHRTILDAYVALSSKGLSCTDEHIHHVLLESGKWRADETTGGIGTGFLVELREHGGIIAEIPSLCQELRLLQWKRDCIAVTGQLHSCAVTWNNGTWEDVEGKFSEVVSTFSGRPNTKTKPTDISSLLTRDLEILEQQARGVYAETIIESGYQKLDYLTGGFRPGNLVVLAGRPGMGKTSLALDIALNVIEGRVPTAMFSFEMTSQEILRRIMSKFTDINVLKLRQGMLGDQQLQQYKEVSAHLNQLPLDICDLNLTPDHIELHIQALNRRLESKQVRLVIVDHLHIMGTTDKAKYERRDRQLATYTSQLKDLAKRNDCCVLLLSQLNRMSEHRSMEEREPRLADLRESGAIEQDADVVLGIHLPAGDEPIVNPSSTVAQLKILKNRSGPIGFITLTWRPDVASFDDPDDYSDVPF